MWTRVCVMARCLSHHTAAAAVCGGFAAEHRAGRRYRSPVVGVMPSSSGTMATCDFEVLKKFLRNYYFASYPRRVCLYVWLYVYLLKASKKGRKSVSKSLLFLTKREQCIRNGTSETRCETQIHKKQVFFNFWVHRKLPNTCVRLKSTHRCWSLCRKKTLTAEHHVLWNLQNIWYHARK